MHPELLQLARERKSDLEGKNASLHEQVKSLEAKIENIKSKIDQLPEQLKRATDFENEDGFVCPNCYIDGKRTEFTPVPGPGNDDEFRCRTCGVEFSFRA